MLLKFGFSVDNISKENVGNLLELIYGYTQNDVTGPSTYD